MLDVDRIAEQLVTGVCAYVDKRIGNILARIEQIEQRDDAAIVRELVSAEAENIRNEVKSLIPCADSITEAVKAQMNQEPVNWEAQEPDNDLKDLRRAVDEHGEILSSLSARVEAIGQKEMPDIQAMIDAAIAGIEMPASLSEDEARTVAREVMERALPDIVKSSLPDAVTMEEVNGAVESAMEKAVASVQSDRGDDREKIAEIAGEIVEGRLEEIRREIGERVDARVSTAIAQMPVPKDGVGLAGAHIDRDGILTLTMTDGKQVPLGKVHGDDGFGFDDVEACLADDERSIMLVFTKGERVREFQIEIPALVDRGVWREGAEYRKGDCVTFGGSIWIAQKHAPDSRPGFGEGWRLAVKKGRDGRDAGAKGEKS